MKIAIILRKPPYGDINAAEAVRHALGAVSDDIGVSLIMLDGGVLLSKKGQDEAGTGFTNLGVSLKDCIDMGVSVYADKTSLWQEHLEPEDIIAGINIVNSSEASELIKDSDHAMIF